jgi:hypothetical protein
MFYTGIVLYIISFFVYFSVLIKLLKGKKKALESFESGDKIDLFFYLHLIFTVINYVGAFLIALFIAQNIYNKSDMLYIIAIAAIFCIVSTVIISLGKRYIKAQLRKQAYHV